MTDDYKADLTAGNEDDTRCAFHPDRCAYFVMRAAGGEDAPLCPGCFFLHSPDAPALNTAAALSLRLSGAIDGEEYTELTERIRVASRGPAG